MYRPETKKVPAFLQIFDYNIGRVEAITDRRGLEQALILIIASCLDAEYDERHKSSHDNIFLCDAESTATGPSSARPTSRHESQMGPNEVFVSPLTEPDDIVDHCLGLLDAQKGSGLELIVIRGQGDDMARRALSIAERIKVGFYRLPLAGKGKLWDGSVPEELYLYARPLDGPSAAESQQQEGSSSSSASPSLTQASSIRPRIKLGPPSSSPSQSSSDVVPRESGGSSGQRSPAARQRLVSGISIFLSKSKLEEFEAEQARTARAQEEKRSQLLAERLHREEEQQRRPGRTPPGRPQQIVAGNNEHRSPGGSSIATADGSGSATPSEQVSEPETMILSRPGSRQESIDSNGTDCGSSRRDCSESDQDDVESDSEWSNTSAASGGPRDDLDQPFHEERMQPQRAHNGNHRSSHASLAVTVVSTECPLDEPSANRSNSAAMNTSEGSRIASLTVPRRTAIDSWISSRTTSSLMHTINQMPTLDDWASQQVVDQAPAEDANRRSGCMGPQGVEKAGAKPLFTLQIRSFSRLASSRLLFCSGPFSFPSLGCFCVDKAADINSHPSLPHRAVSIAYSTVYTSILTRVPLPPRALRGRPRQLEDTFHHNGANGLFDPRPWPHLS